MPQAHICGIDFGTSNSAIGTHRAGAAQLVAVEGAELTLPTAIFFDAEEKKMTFGREAMFDYVDGAEGRLMRSLKSILGSSLMSSKTFVGYRNVTFAEVIGIFLKHLKIQAEAATGEELTHVLLGRPVYFVDENPTADREAQASMEAIARAQGFQHIEFQYEPVAAAHSYAQGVSGEEVALVVDIGGGTADFSVVKIAHNKAQILSNSGIHIGGTDIDRMLNLHSIMPHLGHGSTVRDAFDTKDLPAPTAIFQDFATWHKINTLYTPQTMNTLSALRNTAYEPHLFERFITAVKGRQGHTLSAAAEKAKIDLSKVEETKIPLHLLEKGFEATCTREDLIMLLTSSQARLRASCEDALSQAQIKPEEVDTLFFTGGTTAMPAIREGFHQLCPHAKAVDTNRFSSVALGLTLEAQRMFG